MQAIVWSSKEESAVIVPRRVTSSFFTAEFYEFPSNFETEYRVDVHGAYLALHNIVRKDGETVINDSLRSCHKDLTQKITFAPRGSVIDGWSQLRSRSSVIAIHLQSSADEPALNSILELQPSLYFENRTIGGTISKIESVLLGSSSDDQLYVDALGVLLFQEIKRELSTFSDPQPLQGGLTPLQLYRLTEYINEKLSERISLNELSNIVGLSRFHFVRAFKKSLGLSPYQYVLEQRIRRARAILVEKRDVSLGDIAKTAGFGSALQMYRAFRRFVGVSPGNYRKSLE